MSILERLQAVLNLPLLVSRCLEVSQILQEVNNKDGIYVIKNIVESLFGTYEESSMHQPQGGASTGGGWGLRIITSTEHPKEYEAIRFFLAPSGPLLNVIYRLLNEQQFQLLPFPVAWLPSKIRNEIEEGTAGSFYLNKIQYLGPGKTPANLMLNSFEFYVFHYAYFLIGNGSIRWNMYWPTMKDSIYPTLLQDYLAAYLPYDGNFPPGPPHVPTSPRGVLSPLVQRPSSIDQVHPIHHNIFASPTLSPMKGFDYHSQFDSPAGNIVGNAVAFPTSSTLHATPYPEVSIWTSQTVVQIFMELWVNLCCPSSLSSQNTSPLHGSKMSSSHPSMENVFIPDCDHVRVVRMLIKHFHYFNNNMKPNQSSPLDSMRKNLWPVYRKSIYCFIKHLFVHWPLDSSFRLVLETWLSHIQPWRYVSFSQGESDVEGKEVELHRTVSSNWKTFLAENYLFYSSFFNFFLKRILKLDLSSSKNAQILFRVAKVFSQENLMPMLKDIESSLDMNNPHKSGLIGGFLSHSTTFSKDAQDSHHSPQALTQIVRSHILDVERSNYHHVPIFGEDILKDIFYLIDLEKKTIEVLKAELENFEGISNLEKTKPSSWIKVFFRSLFAGHKTQESDSSMEEVKRSMAHLETSINQFCFLFDVNICEMESETGASSQNIKSLNEMHLGNEKFRVPDQVWTDSGLVLSHLGREQLLNGLRRLDLKYEGDPDLRPICSFEVGFLVKILYHLSSLLNSKYEKKLTESYYRGDVCGRICRVVLSPPQAVFESGKFIDPQNPYKRVVINLPPRISLRPLAQKNFVFAIGLLYTLLWLCGFSQFKITFFAIIPFFLIVAVIKAFSAHEFPTRDHLHTQ